MPVWYDESSAVVFQTKRVLGVGTLSRFFIFNGPGCLDRVLVDRFEVVTQRVCVSGDAIDIDTLVETVISCLKN